MWSLTVSHPSVDVELTEHEMEEGEVLKRLTQVSIIKREVEIVSQRHGLFVTSFLVIATLVLKNSHYRVSWTLLYIAFVCVLSCAYSGSVMQTLVKGNSSTKERGTFLKAW